MTTTLSINVGGRTFEIRRLTIRQLRDLRAGEIVASPEEDIKSFWGKIYDVCIKTILIGARASDPTLTEESLWELPATEDELTKARSEILLFAGLRKPEPTIAQLRATVVEKRKELEQLERTLAEREAKAKLSGE